MAVTELEYKGLIFRSNWTMPHINSSINQDTFHFKFLTFRLAGCYCKNMVEFTDSFQEGSRNYLLGSFDLALILE